MNNKGLKQCYDIQDAVAQRLQSKKLSHAEFTKLASLWLEFDQHKRAIRPRKVSKAKLDEIAAIAAGLASTNGRSVIDVESPDSAGAISPTAGTGPVDPGVDSPPAPHS